MDRTADYTIQGFLYQFNKTLVEILNSPDDSDITVEGTVEDIDIEYGSGIKAIQCKYHEGQERFALSLVYKPILQMMQHFVQHNGGNVRYILYAYFPSQTPGDTYPLKNDEIKEVLASQDKKLRKYIDTVDNKINIDDFLKCFSLEFGKLFDDLIDEAHKGLIRHGFNKADVEAIAYPNAINDIAMIACKHLAEDRKTSKLEVLEKLRSVKKTAITCWTLALKTRKQILDARKKQMKPHLNINARLRYFIISKDSIADFDSEIVLFVSDYLNKYHFKAAHICTPLFCLNCTIDDFNNIRLRIHQKGIIAVDGFVGDYFDEALFFREPMTRKRNKQEIEREFHVRLAHFPTRTDIIKSRKGDDLFIIGELDHNVLDMQDVCVERLAVSNLKEAKYLLGVTNDYE